MNNVPGLGPSTGTGQPAQSAFDTLINVAPERKPKAVLAAWQTEDDDYSPPLSAEQQAFEDGRYQDVSWAFLEATRAGHVKARNAHVGSISGNDEAEAKLDAIEAQYYPKEFAALLVERAKTRAQMQADFAATKMPPLEVSPPDALLTNLAPNSTPLKGQIPPKPVDVKVLSAEADRQAREAKALEAERAIIMDAQLHPAVDAIKTCLPYN
jgi:hypothetical protein